MNSPILNAEGITKKNFEGVDVAVKDSDGRIVYMTDWCRADEFAKKGYFTTKFYKKLWGHKDYYLA